MDYASYVGLSVLLMLLCFLVGGFLSDIFSYSRIRYLGWTLLAMGSVFLLIFFFRLLSFLILN